MQTTVKERQYDDRCLHIQAMMKEKIEASQLDIERYAQCMHSILSDLDKHIRDGFWMIGGHTHKTAFCKQGFEYSLKKCKEIMETGKFMDKNALSYVTFCCSDTGHQVIIPQDNTTEKQIDQAFKDALIRQALEDSSTKDNAHSS